jgi:hypothetical protein
VEVVEGMGGEEDQSDHEDRDDHQSEHSDQDQVDNEGGKYTNTYSTSTNDRTKSITHEVGTLILVICTDDTRIYTRSSCDSHKY